MERRLGSSPRDHVGAHGGGAPKGVDGIGNETVTTAAQFAHAHSLHSSNFSSFSVFRGVNFTKNSLFIFKIHE